jgi:short-subunit dehydrogenase
LVTGASRGIGHEIAKKLVTEGYEVIGTSRHPNSLTDEEKIPGVRFTELDLLKPESVDTLISQFDTIDLLVNNAGFSQIGALEETPWDKINELYTADFFSQIRLIKGFIPIMRNQRSGTLVNITSLAGTNSNPYGTIYASCKAAFDRLSQGLRYELGKFNIKVISIAPLWVQTQIPQEKVFSDNSPYLENINRVKAKRDDTIKKAILPTAIACQLIKILRKRNPGAHYFVGRNRYIYTVLLKHLPQKWLERIVKNKFKL